MSRDHMPWESEATDPRGVAPRTTDATRRAAIAVWITAGVQLLVFGCCAALLAGLSRLPEALLREEMAGQVPQEQIDQLIQSQTAMLIGAGVLMLVMFLPALLLLILGFKVHRRSRPATTVARAVLVVQGILVTIMLVMYVAGGIAIGDTMAICLAMVVLGGTLALVIWTIRALSAALRELERREADDREPWNTPLA